MGRMILAIDPGTTESGWALYADGSIVDSGVASNAVMLATIRFRGADHGSRAWTLAIETMQANYAATVGKSVIDTLVWIGRFMQAWHTPHEVRLITRQAVKAHICGNVKAKDAGVRQALIDKLGPPGTKKNPGPTYGVTSHAWQALAVAVTAAETA